MRPHLNAQSRREPASHCAQVGSDISQRVRATAAPAPRISATINPGASAGWIPANVSLNERATVTAGFAKEVEAVNQYAAPIYPPTAKGTIEARYRAQLRMTSRSPNVAMNSLHI